MPFNRSFFTDEQFYNGGKFIPFKLLPLKTKFITT